MLSRSRAPAGSSDCLPSTYESTEDFVAQIARRVREESSLRGLELTPVTGLGPLADLKTSSIPPMFTGPSSVENGGKSRGEYACGECSSRFDTARDYRAHCLTHQVLKAESMMRSSRGGSRERVDRRGDGGDADSPGVVFGGLGLGSGGGGSEAVVSFTCEDCNTRFSSRDTYAMHMLIRAKNEACFPSRSLPPSSTTTTASTLLPAAPTTPVPVATKTSMDASNTDSNHSSNMAPISPTGAAPLPLPGSALLLSAISHPDLKLEGMGKNEMGGRKGGGGRVEGVRQEAADNPHHAFFHSLGLDLSHVADSYSAAWWSKYVPWMAGMAGMAGVGMGLPGGSESGVGSGEGPALPMVCYLCGELFTNRDALAMHVLFHTRDMPTSLPDSASAWKKSLPTFHSSSSSSSPGTSLTAAPTSSSTLILGHAAALRQLQQQRAASHYNNSIGPSAPDLGPPRLSPTEAAVASAAAAAVAAVTPPHHPHPPASQASKNAESSDPALVMNGVKGARGLESYERMSSSGRSGKDFLEKFTTGSVMELGHLNNLSPPQRGTSAPIPATTTTSYSHSPLLPVPGAKSPFRSNVDPTKPLANVRPLSADHVVLRQHRTLMTRPITHEDRRHSDDVTTAATTTWNKSPAKNEGVGWRNGSDIHHNSAFNVYRLQRLKKLRLAKSVYRRPGTRGRPPMTIYGTAGRRPMGAHAPALTPTLSASASSDRVSPGLAPPPPSSSTASSASKMSSMVQLLTSQGYMVSACSHCELLFGDRTLYQLHMGLHNVNNPWQCNACGCVCSNRLHFATHTLHY